MRFRTLLSLSLLVPLVATGAAVMTAMYLNADRHSTEMAHKLLASVTAQAAQEVFAHSEHAVVLARSLERLGPTGLPLQNSDALALELAALLRLNPNISWVSFSNPDGTFSGAYRRADGATCINQSRIVAGKTQLIEHTVDPAGKKTVLREVPDSGYDPRTRPFYIEAVKHKNLVWLPPYIFYEQGIPGISCAVPVFTPDTKNLLGVFSVDYDLNYLSDLARHLAASPHSQVMVFTEDYLLLAHSALRVVQNPGHRDYGKLMTPADVTDPTTHGLLAEMRNVKLPTLAPGQTQSMSFDVGPSRQVACVLPMKLQEGPVMYIAAVAPKTDFAPTALESSRYALLITVAAFLAAGALAFIVAKRISVPLTTLVKASEQIGAGNLDVSISLGSINEFKKLSKAFLAMVVNLKEHDRVRHALALAREIQRSLLPHAPPKIPGFDIAGYSASCDETGGDYYDFIVNHPASPSTLIVALGDMMGHGLPSALLMATARGSLRSVVSSGASPAALLSHMNRLFFADTDGKRFMTMCVAAFDVHACTLRWASAGHDPPIIFDPNNTRFHEPEGGDLPLGVTEHVDYLDYLHGSMCAGQVLFIGSDGVWETYSPAGEQFGKDRVKAVLAAHAHRPADEIQTELLRAIDAFRGPAPMRDDLTFILLKLVPIPAHRTPAPSPATDSAVPV